MTTSELTGLYGAGLSTILLIWKIIEVLHDRARIKVTTSYVLQAHPVWEGREQKSVGLKVVNKGRRSIMIGGAGWRVSTNLKKGELDCRPVDSFPIEIGEGQYKEFYTRRDQMDWSTVEYAWAQDAFGKFHRSSRWPFGKSKMILPVNQD